jgi:uncharacterized protein (TIGR02145 family)
MMKKTFMLFIALQLTVGIMQSQVKIGGTKEAEKGAVLDLNGTDYKGGLLLPNVKITDVSKIPDDFSDATIKGQHGSEPTFTWNTSYSGYFGDNTDDANITAKSDYDPCPLGYRVPSYNEWDYLWQNNTKTNVGNWTTPSISTDNWAGSKFGEELMLPAAGYRDRSTSKLGNRGSTGYYWSNSPYGSSSGARMMYFGSGGLSSMGYSGRTTGYSVRCIAE